MAEKGIRISLMCAKVVSPNPQATSTMADSPAPDPVPEPRLKELLDVISDPLRWRVLDELLKGEPLPTVELARRLHVPANTLSKHMAKLRRAGIVLVGYGSLYRIHSAFLVPGQRALDLGAVVLR